MQNVPSKEQEFIARCVEFARVVIEPRYREFDANNCFPTEIHDAAHEWELMNAGFPVEMGGQGMKLEVLARAGIEMARVCAPTTFSLVFNHGSLRPVLRAGTDWQKQVFVRDILESRGYASWCMTEADVSGSNLMAIQSRAQKVTGGWNLNAAKVMTGNGTAASLFLLLADAWDGDKRLGLTVFAVPSGPGVVVGENRQKLGFRCLPTPDVTFNDVFVGDEHVIGSPGEALPILLDSLDYMRLGGGVITAGITAGAVDDVMPWVENREVYGGGRLSDESHVQVQVGRLLAQLTGLRLLVEGVASRIDQGKSVSAEAASVKLIGSELAMHATEVIMQLHGWRGIDASFSIEKRFRDARQTSIYEGTNEILAMNLFRQRLQQERGK